MQLDKDAIDEFKKLYLQEYGIELTDNQAIGYGMRLVRLVRAVYGNNLPPPLFDKRNEKRNN